MEKTIRKLNNYNFIHKFKDGRTLVWNTFTGSIFLIGADESLEFEAQKGLWFDKNQHYFVDSGVLVDEFEQSKQFNFILENRKRIVEEKKTITFTILPTTACNARCPYCFEHNSKIETMSNDTIEKVVSFINHNAKSFDNIYISWFGGEPLLFKDKISIIMKRLRANNPNKAINCDIVTNGVLFDSKTAQKASKDWLVNSVQISLDGTQNNYERIKNYIGISDAYITVLQNIQNLIKNKINVNIRLNIDKNNCEDMIVLIDELYSRFGNQIQVYPYPIFETHKNRDNLIAKNELFHYLGRILKKLKQVGYREKICEFKDFIPWYCISTLPQNFVIMPNGKLLKCQSEIGQELHIGDIEKGVINVSRNNEYSKIELDKECVECCYLPICQGGCLASTKCASKIEKCCLEKYYFHDLIEKYYLDEMDE